MATKSIDFEIIHGNLLNEVLVGKFSKNTLKGIRILSDGCGSNGVLPLKQHMSYSAIFFAHNNPNGGHSS